MEEQNFELRALMEYNSAEEFFDNDRYMLIDFNQSKNIIYFTISKPAAIIMLLVKVPIINLTKVVKILAQKFQKLQEPILQKLLYALVKLFKAGNMLKNS